MPLFRREYKLIVGNAGEQETGSLIEDLQITFKVTRTSDAAKNKATMRVFNLSPDTRARFEDSDDDETNNPVVILQTQYAEDVSDSSSTRGFQTVFTGQVVNAITSKVGPDLITQIEAQDGYVPLREGLVGQLPNPAGRNFPAGTTRRVVLNQLITDLGVPVGEIRDGGSLDARFENGVTIEGPIRLALDSLLDAVNVDWSIQDDSFVAIRKDLASDEQILVLSPSTGMIGSPQAKKGKANRTTGAENESSAGIKVKSLLSPTLLPNRRVRVISEQYPDPGTIFKATKVTHSGDFRGTNWTTEAELVEFVAA